jgi:HK97 family phage prohead protease
VFWQHRTADPDDIIGRVLTMRETFEGLLITAQLDLSNPLAVSTYERMLAGTLDAMSIGFVYDRKHVDESSGIVVIDSAELLEVSLTPVPSNPRALVRQVKEAT